MKFTQTFQKFAEPVKWKALGYALRRGIKDAGGETIGDSLKLKGLNHISNAVKKNEGLGKSIKTQEGRQRLVESIGKAVPSIAAAGAYGVAANKVVKKMAPPEEQQYY